MEPMKGATGGGTGKRAGFVALVGRPNAGKSTLLNALVGERLSIVTPRAQTTWKSVTGIHTEGVSQLVFLDTPGLLEPRDLLQRSMMGSALEAIREADVVVVVLDGSARLRGRERERLVEVLALSRAPRFAVVNKVDVAQPNSVQELEAWAAASLGATVYRISALTGDGVAELRAALSDALPPGPFLFPEDELASEPVRFFVTELVRETVFEQFHQEIPYAVVCEVGEFREDEDPVYIQVTVFVERASQKGILLGKGGSAIRELGRVSREKIEHFLGRPVYLDLWVKVLPGWRRAGGQLRRLGFKVPGDDETITPG
jgi:GTPase